MHGSFCRCGNELSAKKKSLAVRGTGGLAGSAKKRGRESLPGQALAQTLHIPRRIGVNRLLRLVGVMLAKDHTESGLDET